MSAAVRTIDATVGVCTRTRVAVVVGEDHWDDDASAASRAARGANDAATPDARKATSAVVESSSAFLRPAATRPAVVSSRRPRRHPTSDACIASSPEIKRVTAPSLSAKSVDLADVAFASSHAATYRAIDRSSREIKRLPCPLVYSSRNCRPTKAKPHFRARARSQWHRTRRSRRIDPGASFDSPSGSVSRSAS